VATLRVNFMRNALAFAKTQRRMVSAATSSLMRAHAPQRCRCSPSG
jgi:hypothetical protein